MERQEKLQRGERERGEEEERQNGALHHAVSEGAALALARNKERF